MGPAAVAGGLGPCGPGNGDCCLPHDTPGCDDVECCNAVCGFSPDCCLILWDDACAALAHDFCGGQCFATPPNDLCSDAEPLALPPAGVVSVGGTNINATPDGAPFCVVGQQGPGVWYSVIGTGNTITASTCNQADFDTLISVYCGGCGTVGGSVCVAGADDAPGCAGFTTRVSWCSKVGEEYLILVHGFRGQVGNFSLTLLDDGVPCANAVQCDVPGNCQPGATGHCCVAHQTPGCEDAACCNTVCAIDPFCCEIAWDVLCVDLASELCGPCTPPCPWDCAGNDRLVNVLDLLGVLAQWSLVGTPCDVGGDGVNVIDLLGILGHWGECDQPQCFGEFMTGPWRVDNKTTRFQQFVNVTFAGTGGTLEDPRLLGVTDLFGLPVDCPLVSAEIIGGNRVRFEFESRCIPPDANVEFHVCSEFVPISIVAVEWGPNRCVVTDRELPRNLGECTCSVDGATMRISQHFEMNARFDSNCACCEYRQYIRGRYSQNGKKVPLKLGPTPFVAGDVELEQDTFHEDAWVDPDRVPDSDPNQDYNHHYGHRVDEPQNDPTDTYLPARADGCNYHGTDDPFLRVAAGRFGRLNATFKGVIIDVCNGTEEQSAEWTIDCAYGPSCSISPPGPELDPLVEVPIHTTINGHEAILGIYLYPGDVLTAVASIANGSGTVPIDAAEVNVTVDGLLLLQAPAAGPLPDLWLRGNKAYALYDFAYPPGSPEVVHVTFTFGPRTQEFDVDLTP